MKLIVGLGNVGKEYVATRHNLGFMVVDLLAKQLGIAFKPMAKWQAELSEIEIGNEKVVLFKPLTMMNNSGQSVGRYVAYYQLPPSDVWVVSDDLDLPLGRIRIREQGSSGGHNGLKSIDQALGTENYGHIRVGIASNESELLNTAGHELDAATYVLQNFSTNEQDLLLRVIEKTSECIMAALKANQLSSQTDTV